MVKRKDQTVYVITGKYGMDCFTNLTKLIKAYPVLSYHPIYDALNKDSQITKSEYQITKVKLK